MLLPRRVLPVTLIRGMGADVFARTELPRGCATGPATARRCRRALKLCLLLPPNERAVFDVKMREADVLMDGVKGAT